MSKSAELSLAIGGANASRAHCLVEDGPLQASLPLGPDGEPPELAGWLKALRDYPSFLGTKEVAELFRRSLRTARAWMAAGDLPVVLIGRKRFVPRAALEQMLQQALEASRQEETS